MFYLFIIISSLSVLVTINRIDGLQCYKCSCSVNPNEITCKDDSELQCVIEYVENSYCYIDRVLDRTILDNRPNSDLIFLQSLHYIRVIDDIIYLKNTSTWQQPIIVALSYGCDWNLCNTPRILSLLPEGLKYSINSNLLTETLIGKPDESLTSCLNCTECIPSTGGIPCPELPCSGTCSIDVYFEDSTLNVNTCPYAFKSVCEENIFNTTVRITGVYYIDSDIFEVNDIDIWCQKTNCNNLNDAQLIEMNVTHLADINDQIYFRPNVNSTSPSTPNNELLACYECHCQHNVDDNDCKVLQCNIVYANASFCEIVRDFVSFDGMESIDLGHVRVEYTPYRHFIYIEEELALFKNQSFRPPSISMITYVCDWQLCNDPRIINKLTTSFQFKAESSVIANLIQSSEPLTSCFECILCSNASLDFDTCKSVACASTGRCFIDQYIDDPEFDDCEYVFKAQCEEFASDTSITIKATYSIDDDILDIDEMEVYCSKNDCNRPETIYNLIDLVQETIELDPIFFIRPMINTTPSSNITETMSTSILFTSTTITTSPIPTGSAIINIIASTFIIFNFILIISTRLFFHY